MQLILKNKTQSSCITIIDRRKRKLIDLHPGQSCVVYVESEEEIKEYKRSYEAFGIDISIKETVIETEPTSPEEIKTVSKPKRTRKKTASVEEVEVSELSSEEVK